MEGQKQGFLAFRVRWGYIFSVVLILVALTVGFMFYAFHWFFIDELGLLMPTRTYADQVGFQLWMDLAEKFRSPSEIYRWRVQGEWDAEPEFSKAALFWFTYNSMERSLDLQPVAENPPQELIRYLKEETVAAIDSTLTHKQAGGLHTALESETGRYYLEGLLYKDEPRCVGLVTDVTEFRKTVLPEVLEAASENYPLLASYAPKAEERDIAAGHYSMMFVFYRDQQDSIIEYLGTPGEYAEGREPGRYDYKKEFPFWELIGVKSEVVIPNCYDLRWEQTIRRLFYYMIAFLVILFFLWAFAEVRLSRTRKQLGSK
jgi:hypothetical protein